MNNEDRKEKIAGLLGTLLVHVILFLLLWVVLIQASEPQTESGVPVLLGTELLAQGDGDKYEMTEVDVRPIPEEIPATSGSVSPGEEIISQEMEETVAIQPKKEEKKQTEKKPVSKPVQQPIAQEQPKQKTEAELKAEAEKAAAESAARKIAGAFGKGASMDNRGETESGKGIQGAPEGNSETGKSEGTGGYGVFDLNGRTLGQGGLPRPDYHVQDEGRVVVTIIVNPEGRVVSAEIHRRTNTVNATLRKAALDAARKARFNAIDGVNNQSGTITYFFKLK